MLVVQLVSEESLAAACSPTANQLLVYEMGETFGGYWGPLPDSVLHANTQAPAAHQRMLMAQYTKRTTPKITMAATHT